MPNAETLITENLETWSAAIKKKSSAGRGGGKKLEAYGIKKLRGLILDFAVRGLLIPQDPKDEPASELLSKIDKEKAKSIAKGLQKEGKPIQPIEVAEMPYTLANGWSWARLGDISIIERGGSPRPIKSYITESADGLNWIKIGDTDQGGKYIRSTEEKIRPDGLKKTRMVYPGDFLLTNSMSFGRPYITLIEGCIHDGWLRISPPESLDKDYLYQLLSSPFVHSFFQASAAGAVVQNLNSEKVRLLPISLPPLTEQHRIVAKVDELMALCDQLEQQQEDSMRTHQTLVQTLLGALTAASGRGQFEEAWQRIESNFDTLFTTESSIDELKQTILQLAVMGKLVEQDPKEGPTVVASMEDLVGRKNLKNGLSLSPTPGATEFICLPLSAVDGNNLICSSGKPITISSERAAPYLIQPGDVFIMRGNGSKERVGIASMARQAPPNVLFPDLLIRIPLPQDRVNGEFFLLAWNNPLNRLEIEKLAKTTSGIWKINQGHISECSIPLPPLAEQHRIVAKVDELMALCDALKANLKSAQTTQLTLADTLTGQVSNDSTHSAS